MLFKEPKIVFHHVPKCGGTSIVSGLALTYYPARLFLRGRKGFSARLNSPQSTKEAIERGMDRYDYRRYLLEQHLDQGACPFVSGHYPFNTPVYARHHKDWRFVTLLRDPVARWYSEYDWNRHKNHEYQKTDLSVEAYLESDEGIVNTRSFVNFYGNGLYSNTEMPTQHEVNAANDTLKKMHVIGCLENMERFRDDLKKQFGRKPLFFNLNKSPAPKDQKSIPDTQSAMHKKLIGRLAADIEIYQEARKILKL